MDVDANDLDPLEGALQSAQPSAGPPQPRRRAADRMRPAVDLLSAEDLANQLGCEPEHINALAASHALPAVKIGRSWRFPAMAINAFLNLRAMAHLIPAEAASMGGGAATPPPRRRPADLSRTVKVAVATGAPPSQSRATRHSA